MDCFTTENIDELTTMLNDLQNDPLKLHFISGLYENLFQTLDINVLKKIFPDKSEDEIHNLVKDITQSKISDILIDEKIYNAIPELMKIENKEQIETLCGALLNK